MHFKIPFIFATKLNPLKKKKKQTSPSLLKVWDTFIGGLLVAN